MKTAEFVYDLPARYIAQHPVKKRGATKLMVIDRKKGVVGHGRYRDLVEYVKKGDVIVLNETKVLRARVVAKVEKSGKEVELLFLRKVADRRDQQEWEALIGGARLVKVGDFLRAGDERIRVAARGDDGRVVTLLLSDAVGLMDAVGHVPLPPYIRRADMLEDRRRYNTVFAKRADSAAAPTASINLTRAMLREFEKRGAKVVYIRLAVGLGTFARVDTEEVEDYRIHAEYAEISQEAAQTIRSAEGRVWAFGTTVVRALESAAAERGTVEAYSGVTNLFIYPGFTFQIIDVLVTNFHMPGTSLIMLVSAFAGKELILEAYEEAKSKGYRFLSYGDSMVIGDLTA